MFTRFICRIFSFLENDIANHPPPKKKKKKKEKKNNIQKTLNKGIDARMSLPPDLII